MSKISKIIYFLTAFLLFTFFDLHFSELIVNSLRFNFPDNPLVNLTYVLNSGAAFSTFPNSKIFLIIFAVGVLIFTSFYILKNIQKLSAFTCLFTAILLSGVACNLYERIAFGYVRDFFNLKFINFPVFNISDVLINIGVFAIIIIIVKKQFEK